MSQVTHCEKCGNSLDRGYTEKYRKQPDGLFIVVQTICFTCDMAERWEQYRLNGRLNSQILVEAVLAEARSHRESTLVTQDMVKCLAADTKIHGAVAMFERKVWLNQAKPLWAKVSDCRQHGMSYTHSNGTKFMTYDMAGRVLIAIESATSQVTLITLSSGTRPGKMGYQGVDGTLDELLALIQWAIDNSDAIYAGLKASSKVSMI